MSALSIFLRSLVYSSLYVESINTVLDVVVEWLWKLQKGWVWLLEWIIHLAWWKSHSFYSFYATQNRTRHHRHFSQASSFQLIFIHAMPGLKVRGVRRSKLKRPREHRKSSIDLLNGRVREKEKFMNVENDWNFKRCLFDGSCVMLPISILFLPLNIFAHEQSRH